MNLKYTALVLCIALIGTAGIFYYKEIYSTNFNLNFYIDEKNQPIDGYVYLNGIFVGSTRSGVLSLKKEQLSPGVLNLVGRYHGRHFNFSFNFYESEMKNRDMNFIVNSPDLESFTLNFYISGTNESLDGDVYLNSVYLGKTKNGKLKLNIGGLFPGTITLNGTYKEKNFVFQFGFSKESLGYFSRNFAVSQQGINNEIYDASKLNATEIENFIFDFVNEERQKNKIKKLKRNERLTSVARNYSEKMTVSGFHHKDAEGKDAGDRLRENNIFYILSGENLFLTGNLNSSTGEYDVGKIAVSGWLKSPGHRSLVLDRDELYSDAGAGVYCEEKYCYAAMNFIGAEKFLNYTLDANNCVFHWIYNPSYPFNFDAGVNLQLNSSRELNVYVVSNKSGFDSCVHRSSINPVKEYKNTKEIVDNITIKKGYGLLLETGGYTKVSVFFDYSPVNF